MMTIRINRNILANNAIHIINLACLVSLVISPGRLGLPSSLAILLILVFDFSCFSILRRDFAFLIFLIINLGSIVFFLFNGVPVSLYIQAISYNLIPTMMYLIGANQSVSKNEDEIASGIMTPCVFAMGFGLFFYVFFRSFYYSHIGQSLDSFQCGVADYRFGSYFTSMIIGSLCVCSIPMIVCSAKRLKKYLIVLCSLIVIASIFLCMQRSAWLVAAIEIAMIVLISNMKLSRKVAFISFTLLLVVLIYIFYDKLFSDITISLFTKRFSNTNIIGMVSERTVQWENAIKTWTEYPLGYGMGSFGHKAAAIGLKAATDGNYFRILAELGIEGLICFLTISIRGLRNAFKTKRYFVAFAIIGFLLQGIGTNVFDLTFCSAIFWYLLGYSNHSTDKDVKYVVEERN